MKSHLSWHLSAASLALGLVGCTIGNETELAEQGQALYPDQSGFAACNWTNPFSQLPECAQLSGSGWDLASATSWCSVRLANAVGTLSVGGVCSIPSPTGVCLEKAGQANEVFTTFTGGSSGCTPTQNACTGFAQGLWIATPGGACDGGGTGGTGGGNTTGPNPGGLDAEALDAMRSNALVTVDPECLDDTCVPALADAGDWIEFVPTLARNAKIGVILYGGGYLDPRSYAPAGQAFAAQGYLTAIAAFPANIAINAPAFASNVRAAHPEVKKWVLVGHSLGGVVAVAHIASHENAYAGLALWAAYPAPANDISSHAALKVVSVYGTRDPLTTVANIESGKARLPCSPRSVYSAVEGGNHSGFAYHGLKQGDVAVALIDQHQQFDLAVGATLHLIRRIESKDADYILDAQFNAASALDLDAGCKHTQLNTAGYGTSQIPHAQISNTAWPEFRSFWASSPSINAAGNPLLNTMQYMKQTANPDAVHLPPVIQGELFCKVMTQEAILVEANTPPTPLAPQQECLAQNHATMQWALSQVPHNVRKKALKWQVTFAPDHVYPTGPEFMFNPESVVNVDSGGASRAMVIRSRAFRAGLDPAVWGTSAGREYCKTVTRQKALSLVYFMAEQNRLSDAGGSCSYLNPFSGMSECKHFDGAGWREKAAEHSCDALFEAQNVRTAYSAYGCDSLDLAIGRCTVDQGAVAQASTYFYEGEQARLEQACEQFAGGVYENLVATAGSCAYTNPFSRQGECKDYTGSDWTYSTAGANCAAVFPQPPTTGTHASGSCVITSAIGSCTVGAGTANTVVTYSYAGNPVQLANACVQFAGGAWADLTPTP